jgi:hypothetical protein
MDNMGGDTKPGKKKHFFWGFSSGPHIKSQAVRYLRSGESAKKHPAGRWIGCLSEPRCWQSRLFTK